MGSLQLYSGLTLFRLLPPPPPPVAALDLRATRVNRPLRVRTDGDEHLGVHRWGPLFSTVFRFFLKNGAGRRRNSTGIRVFGIQLRAAAAMPRNVSYNVGPGRTTDESTAKSSELPRTFLLLQRTAKSETHSLTVVQQSPPRGQLVTPPGPGAALACPTSASRATLARLPCRETQSDGRSLLRAQAPPPQGRRRRSALALALLACSSVVTEAQPPGKHLTLQRRELEYVAPCFGVSAPLPAASSPGTPVCAQKDIA